MTNPTVFDIILRLEADEALEKFTRIAPQQLEAQGGENLSRICLFPGGQSTR
jgi:hypothetical protein